MRFIASAWMNSDGNNKRRFEDQEQLGGCYDAVEFSPKKERIGDARHHLRTRQRSKQRIAISPGHPERIPPDRCCCTKEDKQPQHYSRAVAGSPGRTAASPRPDRCDSDHSNGGGDIAEQRSLQPIHRQQSVQNQPGPGRIFISWLSYLDKKNACSLMAGTMGVTICDAAAVL
jgi:hypothetical protein